MIRAVNEEECQNKQGKDASDASSDQDMFFSFTGCDDEDTQEKGESYNLSYYGKFNIFIDALTEDIDYIVELSDAELSILTNFTQDSDLSQEAHLESLPDTQLEERSIPGTINVSDPFEATQTDGMNPGVAEKIYGGNKKKTKQKYKRWYLKYVEYGQSEGQNIFVESTASNFFHNTIERKIFSVDSVWSIYAAINKYMLFLRLIWHCAHFLKL